MTPRRYVVRLAREVRQEAAVEVWAEDEKAAELEAWRRPSKIAWDEVLVTDSWVIEMQADEPPKP